MSDAADSLTERAHSFGSVAEDYDRWRPGVDPSVVDWFVPAPIERAIDVGAGTGKLSRLLVGRAADVVCVEPDARMRAVLTRNVPEATVLEGRGERIPVEDASADAVVVSSAWHWMDHDAAAAEVARVLRPDGVLGVVWSGLDWTADWFRQVRAGVEADPAVQPGSVLAAIGGASGRRDGSTHVLTLPGDAPFGEPEQCSLSWELAMTADDLVGLLGTVSGVIVLPDDRRREVMAEAREMLRRYGGLEGDAAVTLPFQRALLARPATGASRQAGRAELGDLPRREPQRTRRPGSPPDGPRSPCPGSAA